MLMAEFFSWLFLKTVNLKLQNSIIDKSVDFKLLQI